MRGFLFVDAYTEVTSEPSASKFISIAFNELHVHGLNVIMEVIQIVRDNNEYQPVPVDDYHPFEDLHLSSLYE